MQPSVSLLQSPLKSIFIRKVIVNFSSVGSRALYHNVLRKVCHVGRYSSAAAIETRFIVAAAIAYNLLHDYCTQLSNRWLKIAF